MQIPFNIIDPSSSSVETIMPRDADADHTLSSIALLQERFRQLHRIKELRRERELMRLTSLSSDSDIAKPSPPPPPARPHCQLALSLWPDSKKKGAVKSYKSPDHAEIDTSLQIWQQLGELKSKF